MFIELMPFFICLTNVYSWKQLGKFNFETDSFVISPDGSGILLRLQPKKIQRIAGPDFLQQPNHVLLNLKNRQHVIIFVKCRGVQMVFVSLHGKI